MVSCGSGWKTAGFSMMKLPQLFLMTQRDSDETPDEALLRGSPAASTADPKETLIELCNHPHPSSVEQDPKWTTCGLESLKSIFHVTPHSSQ